MGQASVSKPFRGPVPGEVDVGLEALVLLSSREEHSTSVTVMMPTSPPPHKPSGISSARRRRNHKRRSCMEGEQQQEHQSLRSRASLDLPQLPPKNLGTEEQQLADVFYALLHLHAPQHPLAAESGGGDSGASLPALTRDELRKELIDIFEAEEAMMLLIEEQVQARSAPKVTLHIAIHQARDLKPKTPKDTSHPYCIVRVTGSSETFKTRVLTDTLTPAWESEFSMWIPSVGDAKLIVQVWHDPQEAGTEQHTNMKDKLERFVRDAAASLQPNEMRNLLGSVTLPLADIKEQKIEGWYNLTKSREEEFNQVSARESFRASKKRGSLHLSLKLSTIAQLNLMGAHWFDSFLSKVIQHHLDYLSSYGQFRRGGSRRSERSIRALMCSPRSSVRSPRSRGILINKSCSGRRNSLSENSSPASSGSSYENEGILSISPPWTGTLSTAKACLLEHYATTLSLTPAATALSWWKVSSKLCVVDQAFLGTLLKTLQSYLGEGQYSVAEIEEIKSSLKLWVETVVNSLKNLTTCFPSSSKIVSYAQLQGLIRNFNAVQKDPNTEELQIFPQQSSISQLISDSLMDFSRMWWEACLKNKGRNSHVATEDQQLVFAVSVAGEVYTFLADVCNFYQDVFLREASISFLKLTYMLLTSELGAHIRPLLHQIYDSSARKSNNHASLAVKHNEADRYSLEPGTPVWQLYKKCEIIEKIGENLPHEVQLRSGLESYHLWFLGGIKRWMERLFSRTRFLMVRDIEKDDFEINSGGVSCSAIEAKSNFRIIKSSWQKLSWPEELEREYVAKPLLFNLCGLGTHFTNLVIAKLESMQREENKRDSSFLSAQTCTGLNNIQCLRLEIEGVPALFELLSDNEDSGDFSTVAKTSSKMEESVLSFMDSVIRKMKPIMFGAVEASCECGNEFQLLQEVLDKELCALRQRLDDNNFEQFVLKIWRTLIVIFSRIVEVNSTKRSAEFFKNVHRVLERSWYFFTPTDRTGLDPQLAHTAEYQSLLKTLCNLKMPTETLIAKYYRERYEELQRAQACCAELVVRAFFLRTGKLVIEVIMVRSIVSPSGKPLDTQVHIKLVPREWFGGNLDNKTKTQRRNEAPVFQEKFELPISPTDTGVRGGHLLFLLKSQHLLQSEVIAETVLPLEELPAVDTSSVADVTNKFLNMNLPKSREDYTAVKALRFRTWDGRAQKFLQKMPAGR